MPPDIAEPHADARNGSADATTNPDTAAATGDLSVREAVRRALAQLGTDAELEDVLAHLRDQFALDPPRGTVQTYLCLARKDAREATTGEPRRRGRPRKTNGHGQPPTAALDEIIDAVEILRDLAERLGDDNLRRLLDAL